MLLGLAPVAVPAQEFIGYEGKNAVREGDGGAKKTVEGVDFWSDGAPPRKFVLLGYVTDRRHKSGIMGNLPLAVPADFALTQLTCAKCPQLLYK